MVGFVNVPIKQSYISIYTKITITQDKERSKAVIIRDNHCIFIIENAFLMK